MIQTLITILVLILIARLNEKFLKIPISLSLIAFSYIIAHTFPSFLHIPVETFDETLLLLLPIILLPDVMHLKLDKLKNNALPIFFFAFIGVAISIFLGVIFIKILLPEYAFSIGALISLFAMVLATDAITVSSVFKNFKLPEDLKIITEGESLFNDATALIAFYFIGLPMLIGSSVSVLGVSEKLIEVMFLSVAIGVIIGYLGYLLLKLLEDPIDEFIIMYIVSLSSFLIAEHFHVAGILSIIFAVMVFKYNIDKDLKFAEEKAEKVSQKRKSPFHYRFIKKIMNNIATTKESFKENLELSIIVAHFANGFLFISMALLVDFEALFKYWKEIIIIFILTTFLRGLNSIAGVVLFKKPISWAYIFTFAGMKGGLSIIMVHLLPDNFIYKEMFEAIVIGIVLLSMFVYSFLLIAFLKLKSV